MKIRRNSQAVAEIVGAMVLLTITVAAFSVIYLNILSNPGPQDTTEVTIVGKIEHGYPTFDFQRGEYLIPDSTINIEINGNPDIQPLKNYIGNQNWNIGQQIIKKEDTYDPVNPPQVKATIVDTKTNTIVFWGILQGGLTTGHKGGIWHLDENQWNGVNYDVKDSSGNKNHGKSVNGAQPQSYNSIKGNAGNFSGYTDRVTVNTSWALNITNSITIEAWMQPQPLEPIGNFSSVPLKFGYTPVIIHVVGDIYAVVSEDYQKGSKIATIKIEPFGNMTVINSESFGKSTSNILPRPMITQMTENIYLVSYIEKDNYIHLKTFNISSTGNITTIDEHILNEYQASNSIPNRVSLQKITANCCVVAYWMPGYGGILRNVTIDSLGNFIQVGNIIQYDNEAGFEPFLINITGDVYALAYRGSNDSGILKTYKITSTGDISNTHIDVELYESGNGYEPCIVQISGNIYAIAYRNVSKGYVKTYQIFSNGFIQATGQTKVFEEDSCYDPRIIHGEKDIYVISYATDNKGNPNGFAVNLEIEQNGLIGPVIGSQQFEYLEKNKHIDTCFIPIILRISEDIFVVSYTGINHEGVVIKIFLPQTKSVSDKGITKPDSYGIYATTSRVWGSINNINVSDTISSGWHHFAITYDGMTIRLYIDGKNTKNQIYVSPQINKTASDLYFGRYYSGYIDEIAIYDEALEPWQVWEHSILGNAGIFNHYLFH